MSEPYGAAARELNQPLLWHRQGNPMVWPGNGMTVVDFEDATQVPSICHVQPQAPALFARASHCVEVVDGQVVSPTEDEEDPYV